MPDKIRDDNFTTVPVGWTTGVSPGGIVTSVGSVWLRGVDTVVEG